MFFEERIIDGVLCWRQHPDAVFTPYTIEELSKRAMEGARKNMVHTYRTNCAKDLVEGKFDCVWNEDVPCCAIYKEEVK